MTSNKLIQNHLNKNNYDVNNHKQLSSSKDANCDFPNKLGRNRYALQEIVNRIYPTQSIIKSQTHAVASGF